MDKKDFLDRAEEMILSKDFINLTQRLRNTSPNFFQILGVAKDENLVSRFLAWSLDPTKHPHYGTGFLNTFLVEAVRKEPEKLIGLSMLDIRGLDLSDCEVKLEQGMLNKKRADIVIRSEKNGLLVLIENKIKAEQGETQLQDYYDACKQLFPEHICPKRIFLFLTRYGAKPNDLHYISVSYSDILESLHQFLQSPSLTFQEHIFLTQFQEAIRREVVMDNKETRDLIQLILEQYGDVIETITQTVEQTKGKELPVETGGWDGKSWFFNTGDHDGYPWENSYEFGFICAGGTKLHADIMKRLKVGDTIYAYVSRFGYVGIATITAEAVPFGVAVLPDGRLLKELGMTGNYSASDDHDKCDYIALVNWDVKVPKDKAVRENPISVGTAARVREHRTRFVEEIRKRLMAEAQASF